MSVPARECRTCKFFKEESNPNYGECRNKDIKEIIGAWAVTGKLFPDADFGCNLWEVKAELKILRSGE